MDQVKVILKQLQKYHFWLLCIVAIIAGLVGSMLAARSLTAIYAQEKQKIDAKFQSLTGILGTDPYPNTRWKEGVEKLNGQEQVKVRKAWELVYEDQKSLLVWPAELKDDFLSYIANNPTSAEIPKAFCDRYGNYIKNEFPRLLKIVDAAPFTTAKASNTRGPAAKNDEGPAHEHRVIWDSANEGEIHKSLDWEHSPSSAEVRRAQEDLWVYTALLTIIKNVNDEQQFTTPVREIMQIQIGKPAADSFQASLTSSHIIHLQAAAAADAPAPAAAAPAGEPAEPGAVKPVDDGRYVDENGNKLGPGATADAEFKRMPIFMKLKIDQRHIPRFLVECANSPLPIEVRELRINPSKGGSTSSSRQSAAPKSGSASDGPSYDLPIELHGILYIYNKPNTAKLGGVPGGAAAPPPSG